MALFFYFNFCTETCLDISLHKHKWNTTTVWHLCLFFQNKLFPHYIFIWHIQSTLSSVLLFSNETKQSSFIASYLSRLLVILFVWMRNIWQGIIKWNHWIMKPPKRLCKSGVISVKQLGSIRSTVFSVGSDEFVKAKCMYLYVCSTCIYMHLRSFHK